MMRASTSWPLPRGAGRLLLTLAVSLGLLLLAGSPARAETGMKALVLGSTVTGGASSPEATNAAGNGFAVDVVDDATWVAKTAAGFADYQLVIVGDPTCAVLPPAVGANATALADAVMARAGGNTKAGNRILIGTDPVFHLGKGGSKLIETGIDFAGVQDGATNLYLSISCFDADYDGNGKPDAEDKLLPLLTADATPNWTQNTGPPCGGAVSLISNAAQFATLTTANLQGWGCSVHESFPTFPTDWSALAVATDTPTKPTCGTDVDTGAARCGEAYILIAGSGIVVTAPDLSLDPKTAENPVGTKHTVKAKVTNSDSTPRSGVEVSFLVTGANAGAAGVCAPADCKTNAAGEVTFTYTGTNPGDDTINAAITVDGSRQTATAAKTWVAPPPVTKCHGREATITGTAGPDDIVGTPHADVVVALGGDDHVSGLGGNDVICAGDGNDRVAGGAGNDLIFGEEGDDRMFGESGNDGLDGGAGTDYGDGGSGRDAAVNTETTVRVP